MVANWIMEHGILEQLLFHKGSHLEIVQRCDELLAYLLKCDKLTHENIDAMWSLVEVNESTEIKTHLQRCPINIVP